jgi:Acetyltransferases
MHTYRFTDALSYSFEQLTTLHNTSFEGYLMPIQMTPAQVADFWRVHQIDATRCVVMHDEDERFVGMARMGTRGNRGWCGGFGIVPAFRGVGASRQLAEEMVRVARDSGLAQLQLEVLSQNTRAIKLYERVGFRTRRCLFGLEIAVDALPVSDSADVAVERVPITTLLAWSQPYPAQLCWGRELGSLLMMDCEMLVAHCAEGQKNALIVQRVNDKLRIQTALLQPHTSTSELAALLRACATDASGIQIYNEPEDSALLPLYRALGFTEFFSQYEMFHAL